MKVGYEEVASGQVFDEFFQGVHGRQFMAATPRYDLTTIYNFRDNRSFGTTDN